MLSNGPSVIASVHACVRPSVRLRMHPVSVISYK